MKRGIAVLGPGLGSGSEAHLAWSTGAQAPHRSQQGLSLRWRLLLLVLTSIVPLLVFALAYQYKQFRNDVETTGRQNLALARSLALQVENQLQADIDALGVLAGSEALQSGDFDRFRNRAEAAIRQQFPGAALLVIGRDGQQLLNTRVPSGTVLSRRAAMASTRQVFATGRPAVSNLFEAGPAKRFVVAIDVPIIGKDGKTAYVLSMNPDLEDFGRILRQQKPPSDWIASVFDSNGVIIARTPNGDRFVGQKAGANFFDSLVKLPEGITENISRNGIPVLSTFSHGEAFGWSVGIAMPRSDMTRPAQQAAINTLIAGSGFLAIGLALALYAARHIAQPIESLRRLAVAVHSAAPAMPPVTGLPEVDDVARALHAANEARRQSQDAEAVLRDGIETMPEGLAVYDDQDRLVICNESYKHLFPNRPEDVVVGARFEDMLHSGVVTGYYTGPAGRKEEWIAERIRDHQQPGAAIEERLADGRWVLVSHHRLPNGWLAGLRVDITERKETEHKLVQSQKMEAIGNLTGGMAHDFNNLLGIIIGNLDLARGQTGGEVEDLVSDAHEAAWRGADLTRRLLAFARRQPLRPEPISVNDLVANTVRLLRPLLGEAIEVSLHLADDLRPATADPAQLESSLANLATNARDAMPKGGKLIIATANRRLDADYATAHVDVAEGDYVMIEVSDTGCGMAPATLERIFEPFFTTKDRGKGTGLGLSMVFGFLRQSGGHINVYSELDAGTTFRLYLPRATTPAQAREDRPVTMPAQGAGETILVVEDNPEVRRIVMRQLKGLGYRAVETSTGAEALEILDREPVDLLLTDIVMPGGIDGVDLAQIALEKWPKLKVVLTSGFPETRIEIEDETLRNLRLLGKPYSRAELATVLRSALIS
jgi:signal transduction histidine kinase